MSKKGRILESEFKIMILEEREGALSETEELRLKSLKEQLVMQKKLGWVGKKVVSEKVFRRVFPSKGTVQTQGGSSVQAASSTDTNPKIIPPSLLKSRAGESESLAANLCPPSESVPKRYCKGV